MLALILVLASVALFAGFLILTSFETRRGARFFPRTRAALDGKVATVTEGAAHIDLGAAINRGARKAGERVAHDAAHVSLIAVRAVERTLSHTVRSLRTKRAESAHKEAAPSSFASTMKDFTNDLRSARTAEGEASEPKVDQP